MPQSIAKGTTHILRVSWKPKVYRDIEIEGTKSLSHLAEAITMAFDFSFDHAFGFYSDLKNPHSKVGERYELFADTEDGDSDANSVEKTQIDKVFAKIGKKMLFLFDYGDEWHFQVELRAFGKKAPTMRYPRMVASVGDAPEQYDFDEDA